jgi:chromosome segregation ATPase
MTQPIKLGRVLIMVYSNKNEFLLKVEEKLSEIKGSMDKVKADMENAADDEKAKLADTMEDLKDRYEEGAKRLEEFKQAPDVIWAGLEEELEAFWNKMTGK